ncbi:hypothetical protein K458DRAFT_392884 [Lentithecium fluviatile CBS 122367]|uniref:Uncharacterized protein n=1 Tax=Lentithecium fluviatile CBS 122367 TaxID=1168545 RepID=A0A6G1IR11_9PLEO|nr:hypothetical protein K458DRAFT_392884 [Lentithecium fluviatile CBS 122367]
MRFLPILAISSVSLAAVISQDATSISKASGAVNCDSAPLAEPQFGGFVSEEAAQAVEAELANGADLKDIDQDLGSGGEMLRLYEHPGFWGQWWALFPLMTGYSPHTGQCQTMPDNACKGLNGHMLWLRNTVSDLRLRGWDDKVSSIKCYWDPVTTRKRDGVSTLHMLDAEAGLSARSTNSDASASTVELIKRDNETVEMLPPGVLDTLGPVIRVFEHPNYGGAGYEYGENYLRTAQCATTPADKKISAIQTFFDAHRVMCTGYKNRNCQGTNQPGTELGIVRSIPDLRTIGFDDVLCSFKCYYWNEEASDAESVENVAKRGDTSVNLSVIL